MSQRAFAQRSGFHSQYSYIPHSSWFNIFVVQELWYVMCPTRYSLST